MNAFRFRTVRDNKLLKTFRRVDTLVIHANLAYQYFPGFTWAFIFSYATSFPRH